MSTKVPSQMIKMSVKIAMINLCLGLKSKKDLVKVALLEHSIDILCMQETEIPADFSEELIQIPGFDLELEVNATKRRVGMYINSKLSFRRRFELEGNDSSVVIIDLFDERKTRIINIYRNFNPVGMSARNKFIQQLKIIKLAFTKNTVLLGDFNLDYTKKFDQNYMNRVLFEDFEEHLSSLDLNQLVNFPTWSRIINLAFKTSIIDHIYVKDPTCVSAPVGIRLCFSDHDLIMFTMKTKCVQKTNELKRDWRFYSKSLLCNKLANVEFNVSSNNVQECWNDFENILIVIVDEILPMRNHCNEVIIAPHCPFIKHKLNLRRRLLKNFKTRPTLDLKQRIKHLNIEIKNYFYSQKQKKIF